MFVVGKKRSYWCGGRRRPLRLWVFGFIFIFRIFLGLPSWTAFPSVAVIYLLFLGSQLHSGSIVEAFPFLLFLTLSESSPPALSGDIRLYILLQKYAKATFDIVGNLAPRLALKVFGSWRSFEYWIGKFLSFLSDFDKGKEKRWFFLMKVSKNFIVKVSRRMILNRLYRLKTLHTS